MYLYISTNRDKFYQHDGFFDFFFQQIIIITGLFCVAISHKDILLILQHLLTIQNTIMNFCEFFLFFINGLFLHQLIITKK